MGRLSRGTCGKGLVGVADCQAPEGITGLLQDAGGFKGEPSIS